VKEFLTFIFFVIFVKINYGQQFKNNVGAPYIGLSAYSTNFNSVFGANSNIASIAALKNNAIGLTAEQRFGISDLKNNSLIAGIVTKIGNIAIQANRFGFASFNETQLGLGYAKNISEKISVGGKVNYYNQNIAAYGNGSTVNVEAGLVMHLTQKLTAGISTFNPTGGKFGLNKTEKLEAIYKFGLGYDVSDKVMIATEIVKQENAPVNVISVLHYQFEKKFFGKIGLSTSTSNLFVAAGLALQKNLEINLFVSHHTNLGFSPGVMLQYNFGK
jgi:hypothetical protein